MALVLADRVRETTSSTGTTAVTLGGAYTGFQTFSAGIGNSNSTYYTISDSITGQWEVGIGTYTSSGNTLSRDTVLSSSNSGSLVSFAAGTKDVFVTQPAERNVYVGTNGTTTTLNILTATGDSSFTSTGALTIPVGTTGQQPTGANGKIRYNSTLSQYEGYNSASATWALLGGAVVSNDTSTASNVYPIFAAATSGNISTVYTSNANLLYKPSTGEFQARAPVASNGIVVNSLTVATSYTIAAGFSGASAGPITISGGAVVTVAGGSRWVIS
jgi:hypothetical protein